MSLLGNAPGNQSTEWPSGQDADLTSEEHEAAAPTAPKIRTPGSWLPRLPEDLRAKLLSWLLQGSTCAEPEPLWTGQIERIPVQE